MISSKVSEIRTTRRNMSWVLGGNLIYAATQGGILIALTRLGGAEIVGRFSFGLAVCAPIIAFANCQLRSVQATDAINQYQARDYFGFRVLTTILAFFVILMVGLLSGYSLDIMLVILVIAVAKSFEALSDILFGYLQQKEHMDRIGKSLIIEGLLTFCALSVVVSITKSPLWVAVVMASIWGLQLLFYDLPSARMAVSSDNAASDHKILFPRFSPTILRGILIAGFPLGIAGALNSLTTNIPRYFINSWVGATQLGIFVNAAYLLTISSILGTSVSVALSPRLAQYYQRGNYKAFFHLRARILLIGLAIGASGVVVTALFGKLLLSIIFGQKYEEYAMFFSSFHWRLPLTILGCFWEQSSRRCAFITLSFLYKSSA